MQEVIMLLDILKETFVIVKQYTLLSIYYIWRLGKYSAYSYICLYVVIKLYSLLILD